MPGPVLRDPTPTQLRPSVVTGRAQGEYRALEPMVWKAIRMLAGLVGADNPASQAMGLTMTAVPSGPMVEAVKRLAKPSSRIEADVRAILNQGGDPAVYRTGLASMRGVTLDEVDAAIAAVGGTPRTIHPESLAQERLADDRRATKQNSPAWREANHEED